MEIRLSEIEVVDYDNRTQSLSQIDMGNVFQQHSSAQQNEVSNQNVTHLEQQLKDANSKINELM